eukprot:TRINITY_DN1725_c0_g1_i2.p1 TRINITY_DN1725_c0_g1~~TRINITY_DN1725_c0_g1_i2.p1  ORF type:complete len:1057 (+),score=435.86 TRINITY_DN1725_c0_g1_i2:94-3264(+)
MILHVFRIPGIQAFSQEKLLRKTASLGISLLGLETECCYNVELVGQEDLSLEEFRMLSWLLAETFEPEKFSRSSFLAQGDHPVVEVGPRLNFTTAWSTNAVTICQACGLSKIKRIERSIRYKLIGKSPLSESQLEIFVNEVHDRMTEWRIAEPLQSFDSGIKPQPTFVVPLLEKGRPALEEINDELGLAFDEQDIEMYLEMFRKMGRNPTSVELFDLAQSNSEHSRHWFFRGRIVVDGVEQPATLMDLVRATLTQPNNSVLAFCDNSSALRGYRVNAFVPEAAGGPTALQPKELEYHVIFTAETHNFPTGVAPFPGAETGTGGRLRDVHATGRGGLVVAGTAAYCVGNLHIPGYKLPWEDDSFQYPGNVAQPLKIEIEASNGASDYGNKFGEPLIQGFTRSFGMRLPNGERREWIKPIMFTGGIGLMDAEHSVKGQPEPGMLVVKIGGPAYRIGMGGGAASSLVTGANKENLDFNAVQRGDAEMEQKLNRVIKACVELGPRNPIVSIHDQGAGGSGNVLKEIVAPLGARIEIRRMVVGDETMSVLELWGAEYQENSAALIRAEHRQLFQAICDRERVPVAFVGEVTGDGRVVVHDELEKSTPVDLDLETVLGKMPPKVFESRTADAAVPLRPLELPADLTVAAALDRVLRLVSVGSKLFLTNKVDRSVSGLIAQQQCVGPLQLPLADVAVVAQSHLGITGGATAIGEQPIKGLVNYGAMARLSVAEALTNLVWARITALKDVKCSGNWMWPAKLPGEGAAIYATCVAMRDVMLQLGIAIDGGKDSLSMAARVPQANETVKCPGTLVISAYAACPDITKTATPDIKEAGSSRLYLLDLAPGRHRLGGSSLAHAYNQLGDQAPDLDDVGLLKRAFDAVQALLELGLISAGHDISDGGLIVTLLEMAFAGNCGLVVDISAELAGSSSALECLFAEELGLVFELPDRHQQAAARVLGEFGLGLTPVATTTVDKTIAVSVAGTEVLRAPMPQLRDVWNATSAQLELLQLNPQCAAQEAAGLSTRRGLRFRAPFEVRPSPPRQLASPARVAVVREEGGWTAR